MNFVRIADLGRAVNPRCFEWMLALLRAHVDASADKAPGVTAVAGYVAPCAAWEAIEEAWSDALDYWHLESFRLSGLPRKLGVEKADLCTKYFTGIIKSSGLAAVGSVVLHDLSDDLAVIHPSLTTAYRQSLDMALDELGEYTEQEFPHEDVALIFCADETKHYLEEAFSAKQKRCTQFASSTVANGRKVLSLQCADLGAGLLRRQWSGFLGKRQSSDTVLWADMPSGAGKKTVVTSWCLPPVTLTRRRPSS